MVAADACTALTFRLSPGRPTQASAPPRLPAGHSSEVMNRACEGNETRHIPLTALEG